MHTGRIFFIDNPWPEGHLIKEFTWTAKVIDGYVWLCMHLESANYEAEREIEYDEDEVESDNENEDPSDGSWAAHYVWTSFFHCILSSEESEHGAFRVCRVQDYSAEYLDGVELRIDADIKEFDWDAFHFHIYLQGHDAVSDHTMQFSRQGQTDRFNIEWGGKIALAYVGDYRFRYKFRAMIKGVTMPRLS